MSEQQKQATGSVEEARAAVVATEEAVRVAVERAREVTLRLERLGSGRHLSHELVEIEVEIDHAWQALHEAEQRAYQIEQTQQIQQSQQMIDKIQLSVDTTPDSEETLLLDESSQQQIASAQEVEISTPTQTASTEENEENEEAQIHAREVVTRTSRIERLERVERIDEEEEMVEMSAAMTAADIAAAAAAEAEAFAQASSARTRELRRLVDQADRILERVHVAIERGVLTGDAAEATLYEAEHDASHAHTLLAEAEVTEERARRAAMNAEAEAEVAEGMARATQGRFSHEDYRDAADYALETAGISYSHNATDEDAGEKDTASHENQVDENQEDEDENENEDDDADDAEDTLQLPSIRLKDSQNHEHNKTT